MIVDDDNRVLLVKWRREQDGASFWLCPGGGREIGEDDAGCLAREIAEETGLGKFDPGPHVATWRWVDGYEHRFYVVRCANFAPSTGPGHPEYEVFDEYRWWSAEELAEDTEMEPPGLADLLAAIVGGDVPPEPVEFIDA